MNTSKEQEKYFPNIYSKPVFSLHNYSSFKNNKNITSIKIKFPQTSDNSNSGSRINDTNYTVDFYSNNKSVYTEHNDLISERNFSDNKTIKSDYRSEKPSKRRRNKQLQIDIKEEKENRDKKNLDNFELNNLDYEEAYELDKRSCCKTYLSVIT